LADENFAVKVSAMIAEEPTVLAPRTIRSPVNLRPNILSLGLAASLALVAVIVGKSVNDNSDVFQTASIDRASTTQVAANKSESSENQAESQFNDYLVMHNETAYMAGSAGMLSYVRLVGSRPNH
jgi:sigma-E factor negative regulatory protein RseA